MSNNAATTIEKTVRIGLEFPSTMFKKIGKEIPAIIEDKETMRLKTKTTKKITNDSEHAKGKIQTTIPRIVATPLPPLNPAKTGKICPISAATPKPS